MAKFEIYKVKYGESYGPLEVPDGYEPFAVITNDSPKTAGQEPWPFTVFFAKGVKDGADA